MGELPARTYDSRPVPLYNSRNQIYYIECYDNQHIKKLTLYIIQRVPLATEPGISVIILPLMRILQGNLKRTYIVVQEM